MRGRWVSHNTEQAVLSVNLTHNAQATSKEETFDPPALLRATYPESGACTTQAKEASLESQYHAHARALVSLNLHRRHLNESQRAMVAAKISNLNNGQHATSIDVAVAQPQAADMLNVSRVSVQRADRSIDPATTHRRHLNESQRAMVAAKLATMQKGGDRGNQHTGGKGSIDLLPQAQAAEMLNVSVPSVKRAKKVQESGDASLIADVESGEVTVSAAAKHVAAVQRYPRKQKRPALKPASSPLLTGQQTSRRREDLTFPLTSSRFPSGG